MRHFFYQRQTTGRTGLKANGLWFTYQGHPVYPIGMSVEAPPSEELGRDARRAWGSRLDRLAEEGINLIRFSPWGFCWDARAPQPACPYPIVSGAAPPARYELLRHHEPFFENLRTLCREAKERDLLVLLVVWDDCALSPGGVEGGPWLRHPLYVSCGGPCARPADFYDLQNDPNRLIQQSFVQQVYAATAAYPNVIYELCGEFGASAKSRDVPLHDWLREQLRLARQYAPGHLLGVSGSPWSQEGGSAETLWQEAELDVLLPHETNGRTALCREATAHHFRFYSRQNINKPRIVGEVAFAGAGGGDDERRHLWVALASGGHVIRPASASLALAGVGARAVTEFVCRSGARWWEMHPVDEVLSPDPGRAYALGNPERGEYLIYFLERPWEPVTLALPPGDYRLAWVDSATGRVLRESASAAPTRLVLPPQGDDIALWIRSESSQADPAD